MIKKSLPILVLVIVASLSVAGCTTSTPSTNTVTPSSPVSSDLAADLNKAFTDQGITIVSQFTKTTNQYGNAVYAGVVKDGNTGTTPSVHNITIEEAKNQNDSEARFATDVAQAQKAGYSQVTNTSGDWWGTTGQGGSISKAVTVRISEPNDPISLYRMVIDVQHTNYTVNVDYTTLQ